jgi:chondroitin synthase
MVSPEFAWKPFAETNPLYNTPCSPTTLYKKKVWINTGGYSSIMHDGYEDWEFWINAYKHNMKFTHIPEQLYYYRIKEESRDTAAIEKDSYLKAKIVLIHPELYPVYKVESAKETIKNMENLADIYFYTPKNVQIIDTKIIEDVAHHFKDNSIYNNGMIILKKYNIKIYALDNIKNIAELQLILKNNDKKKILFYASMRYKVPKLSICNLSWDNNEISESPGTTFPYVFKQDRENIKFQLIAYQRLGKFHEYIYNKLTNLEKKYINEQNNAKRREEDLIKQYGIELTNAKKKIQLIYESAAYRIGYNLLYEKKALLSPKRILKKTKTAFKMINSQISENILIKKINSIKSKRRNHQNCIDKILLDNMGKVKLSSKERKQCLEYYHSLSQRKSKDAKIYEVNLIPDDWPSNISLFPLPESTNDFKWKEIYRPKKKQVYNTPPSLSIIIPTYNRSKILEITLACLVNQKTNYKFEIIVADDGSSEDLSSVINKFRGKLDITWVKQADMGYRLCAVRNLGLSTAKYEFVAILDCDMAPETTWVQSYMELLEKDDDIALIGPRKYVDTEKIDSDQILNNPDLISSLPEVLTNNNVSGKIKDTKSIDWRLDHFNETDDLRLCDMPFRYFSGGNVAFAKKWLRIAGWFDEEFSSWGGEDNEFAYRLYRKGCFFRSVSGGLAYHQEPPGKENETDRETGKSVTRKIVEEKVPYSFREFQDINSATIKKVPLVSIYIPAYNCENSIEKCIDSALNQTITDLEVCICDDGSTDNTLRIIKKKYGNNLRVKYITQKNGGIAKASNSAVKLTRGYYIGQLDSDDYLEPDAVETCLNEFMKDKKLVCVYTANRNVEPNGTLIREGYNWPTYSREMLCTTMILHHFRMFTARAWYLTDGFNEKMINAVDYDMFLKLSDIGPFKHINKICYNRVIHGGNTSIKQLKKQKNNHFIAINSSFGVDVGVTKNHTNTLK